MLEGIQILNYHHHHYHPHHHKRKRSKRYRSRISLERTRDHHDEFLSWDLHLVLLSLNESLHETFR